MAPAAPPDLERRLRELERLVAALAARVATIEARLDPNLEHSSDRQTVREKPVYDWQGPR